MKIIEIKATPKQLKQLKPIKSLSLKTHHGWLGPNVYELTDGKISITYYDGDCCCIARDVLKEIKRRVEEDNLEWGLFNDSLYTKNYLSQLCQEMRAKEK